MTDHNGFKDTLKLNTFIELYKHTRTEINCACAVKHSVDDYIIIA